MLPGTFGMRYAPDISLFFSDLYCLYYCSTRGQRLKIDARKHYNADSTCVSHLVWGLKAAETSFFVTEFIYPL